MTLTGFGGSIQDIPPFRCASPLPWQSYVQPALREIPVATEGLDDLLIWSAGGQLEGLQNCPRSLTKASELDETSKNQYQCYRSLLPLLVPLTTFTTTVTATIMFMSCFTTATMDIMITTII